MRSSTARPSSAPRVALASAAVKHPGRGNFCSPHWTILKDANYVREGPEFYVKQMLVYFDAQLVTEFQMTSAVSANPLIRFPFRPRRNGTLRVVFVSSEGQRWEASRAVRV